MPTSTKFARDLEAGDKIGHYFPGFVLVGTVTNVIEREDGAFDVSTDAGITEQLEPGEVPIYPFQKSGDTI